MKSYPLVPVIDLTKNDAGHHPSNEASGQPTKPPLRLKPHEQHILHTEEFLNDTIINQTLRLFKAQFTNMNFQNTYFMEYVHNPNIHHPSLTQKIGEISDSTNKWYIPVHHHGNHWLYIHINPTTHKITQHDSQPTATNTDYTTRIGELLTQHTATEWTGTLAATPIQHNGYDCGVYVLAHILHRLHGTHRRPMGYPSRTILGHMLRIGQVPATMYEETSPTNLEIFRAQETNITHRAGNHDPKDAKTLPQYSQTKIWGTPHREKPMKSFSGQDHHRRDRESNFLQFGDVLGPKGANVIRLYSQNINGIAVDKIDEVITQNLEVMKDREVDIMGWSETNLEWNSYPVHLQAQQTYKQQFTGGKWITTTSAIPSETNLKPGGNAMGLNADTNSRTNVTGKDKLGRWVWATMEGRTGSITVIQLYVPGDPHHTGITTTYAQQYEQLQEAEPDKIPQVLATYYKDLHQLLAQIGTAIILMGDFNEGPEDKNILDLQTRHNLRDIYDARHPNSPLNTHQMGTLRIDQFLVSAPLIPHIMAVGYEAINAGIPSDHRGMFLDIRKRAITNTTQAPQRKLRADNRTKVIRYRKQLYAYWSTHHILRRTSQLEKRSNENTWSRNCTQQLQSLDVDITRGMLQSEHTSRPNHTAPWCPHTEVLSNRLKVIHLNIREIAPRKNQTGPRYPIRDASHTNLLKQLMTQRKGAIKDIRTARATGYANRRTYLDEKADIEELKGNATRQQIIKNIKNVEELRHTYGHIRFVMNDKPNTHLTKVQYPTTTGWKETTTTQELEDVVLRHQLHHFGQPNSTPLVKEGTIYDFPSRQHPNALTTSGVPDTSQGLKKYFLRSINTPEISTELDIQTFSHGIRKWKEATSTSPSGRHLGHYHAQILPPMEDEPKDTRRVFLQVHTGIINLAVKHQVVLNRWKKVDTLCIPKDTGTPRIGRLRPLNLYEADLNLILRHLIARKLTWNAEDNKILPEDNWGGRQMRSAGDLGLQRVLTLQLSSLTRTTLGQIDLDAKSCYDRIIRPVAILACYKFGLPINLCCWLLAILETPQHHLLTTNGRSKGYYASTPYQRLHGAGQGSSSAPTLWLLISSILFISMRNWAQGIKWTSPQGDPVLKRYTDAFVDDTAIWANSIQDPHEMAKRLQADLTKYQEMLTWTGGALTLEKCFFSVLEWKFHPDGQPYLYDRVHRVAIPRTGPERQQIKKWVNDIQDRGHNSLNIFHIEQITGKKFPITSDKPTQQQYLDKCGEWVEIPQKTSTDTQTYLGLQMTPQGDTPEAAEKFHNRNQRFGIRMVSSRLQPKEIQIAFRGVQIPSQQYRFHGAQFDAFFLHKESNFLTTKILPKLGFARTHPLKLRYAPKNRGGLELPHYYVIQGTTSIKQAIHHIRLRTELGITMLYHLKWTQLLVGFQSGILTEVKTKVDYATNTWWVHVRAFLLHIQGNMQVEEEYTFQPLRENDYSVMERLASSGNYGKTTLRRINACRLYLRITYMSEMLLHHHTLDRTWLTTRNTQSQSSLEWPVQQNPNNKTWKIWKRVILEHFVEADGTTLREPVGEKWLPEFGKTRQWKYLFDPIQDIVHHKSTNETYTRNTMSRRNHIFERDTQRQFRTHNAFPITVTRKRTKLLIHKITGKIDNHSQMQENQNTPGPTQKSTHLATDGSVRYGCGTYGWVKGTSKGIQSSGSGHVTGGRGTMNSYRAEAQGVATLMANTEDNEVQGAYLYLDNQGVVRRLQQVRPIHPLRPEWELLEATRKRLQKCNIKTSHVKGHQAPTPSAAREVHLNNYVDELATQAHTSTHQIGETPPGYGIILYIDGDPVTGKYGKAIHHAATTPEIGAYYKGKYGWTDDILSTLDWDAFGRAQGRFTTMQQRNVHKYIHNWLPTGAVQDRRYSTTTTCMGCQQQDTRDHMRQCLANTEDMAEFYQTTEIQLKKWRTEPGLARLWVAILRGQLHTYKGTERNQKWIQELCREQAQIGLTQMWTGFLTQKWGDVQEAYHRRENHKAKYTGQRWVTHLVHSLWALGMKLWRKRVRKIHGANQKIPPHRQDLLKRVKESYDNLGTLPNVLKGLFKHDLCTLLTKTTKYLTRWLRIAYRVPMNEKVASKRRKNFGQDIRRYLPMAMKPPDAPFYTSGTNRNTQS